MNVSIEFGISLSDETHQAVLRAIERDGSTLGDFVDAAVRGELARRDAEARRAALLATGEAHERWTRRATGHRMYR